jgi:transcriptional regulator with XRE-family HTH domain
MAPNELSPEIGKVVSYLELLIASKKLGIREFERRLTMSYGTLARIFSGKTILKFQTVLDMLEVLEVSPHAFFSTVFAGDETGGGAQELLRKVQSLGFPDAPPQPVLSRDEVRRMIDEALAERQDPSVSPAGSTVGGESPKKVLRTARKPRRRPDSRANR